MIKVARRHKVREVFEKEYETITVEEYNHRILVRRFVNGGEEMLESTLEEVINNLNDNGYFISGIDSTGKTAKIYMTLEYHFND